MKEKEDLKTLSKEELESVKGSGSITVRPPAVDRPPVMTAASLCGGSGTCVAIIDVDQ